MIEVKSRVLPTIAIQGDLHFESILPQHEELIDAMADRAPDPEIAIKIRMLRDKGFDLDNIEANLARAEAGAYAQRKRGFSGFRQRLRP